MDLERLKDLVRVVGKQRLVLDLSCRRKVSHQANVTYFTTDKVRGKKEKNVSYKLEFEPGFVLVLVSRVSWSHGTW